MRSLGILGLICGLTGAAQAAEITVTTAEDVLDPEDGRCALREAVIAANTDAASGAAPGECPAGDGADEIILGPGNYELIRIGPESPATGDLDLVGELTVTGAGASATSLVADRASRVIHALGGQIVLQDLTVSQGDAGQEESLGGGAIRMEGGRLILRRAAVSLSRAAFGGGIDAELRGGALILDRCLVAANSGARGAGINVLGPGEFTVVNTSFIDNAAGEIGGAIRVANGAEIQVAVSQSTFFQNSAEAGEAIGVSGELAQVRLVGNVLSQTAGAACAGAGFESLGGNVVRPDSGCAPDALDVVAANLALEAPAQDGETVVVPLAEFSPARRASLCVDAEGERVAVDQRGVARDVALCDAGAWQTPTCGDGLLAQGEQCDDRNNEGGDGCAADCTLEPGWSCLGAPSACFTFDRDQDGAADELEALCGSDPDDGVPPPDADGDGRCDALDDDADGDGVSDALAAACGGEFVDTDEDGLCDPLDDDADGDAVSDALMEACGGEFVDTDEDGLCDPLDDDADGDGVPDGLAAACGGEFIDGDGDGVCDPLDADADGDGVDDAIERACGGEFFDADRDGTCDPLDEDANGDGVEDAVVAACGGAFVDTDRDGICDPLDGDVDGDGTPDGAEIVCGGEFIDTDGDGICDPLDADADGDGVEDALAAACGGAFVDTDGDGVCDPLDDDADGDGVEDAVAAACGGEFIDSDGDGVCDALQPAEPAAQATDLGGGGGCASVGGAGLGLWGLILGLGLYRRRRR